VTYCDLCSGIGGLKKGFEDTRGNVFWKIYSIIKDKKPKIILLENVKHLINHDKKQTLKTIIQSLEDLNYKVSWKVLNATNFGIPQNRERVIIIATLDFSFDFNLIQKENYPSLKDYLKNGFT